MLYCTIKMYLFVSSWKGACIENLRMFVQLNFVLVVWEKCLYRMVAHVFCCLITFVWMLLEKGFCTGNLRMFCFVWLKCICCLRSLLSQYVCSFAWSDMVYGCMVYTERAEIAAIGSGASHVRTKQRCNYTCSPFCHSLLSSSMLRQSQFLFIVTPSNSNQTENATG